MEASSLDLYKISADIGTKETNTFDWSVESQTTILSFYSEQGKLEWFQANWYDWDNKMNEGSGTLYVHNMWPSATIGDILGLRFDITKAWTKWIFDVTHSTTMRSFNDKPFVEGTIREYVREIQSRKVL